MRFHKAEIAFFDFMLLLMAACGALYIALQGLDASHAGNLDGAHATVRTTIYAAGGLLFTGIVFGAFFIFPLILTQVQVGGKLREMT